MQALIGGEPALRSLLQLGEAAPHFRARSQRNPRFVFDSMAGQYVVLAFLPKGADEATVGALARAATDRSVFDDQRAAALTVVIPDGEDAPPPLAQLRCFFDDGGTVAGLFGALTPDGGTHPVWFVFDPNLRLILRAPLHETQAVVRFLRSAPPVDRYAGSEMWAPVLLVPNVLEPELCRRLIGLYQEKGGAPSGFMREVDGKTRLIHDPSHKIRSDVLVEDAQLQAVLRSRVHLSLVPQIAKAFQFTVTRMERYLVAQYDAESGGHFRRHRDNTTAGTAHRRFAVSINLNADFEGGDLRFPEFGPRTYRPPVGGAVVFSCSLLHEATPVTRGVRYAFLPFLYDEAAAKIREANRVHLDLGPQASSAA